MYVWSQHQHVTVDIVWTGFSNSLPCTFHLPREETVSWSVRAGILSSLYVNTWNYTFNGTVGTAESLLRQWTESDPKIDETICQMPLKQMNN